MGESTTIKLSRDTRAELTVVQSEIQIKERRRMSCDEVVRRLIEVYRANKGVKS